MKAIDTVHATEQTLYFHDDGATPNSRFPVLLYHLHLHSLQDPASAFEALFAAHDWTPLWRAGIFDEPPVPPPDLVPVLLPLPLPVPAPVPIPEPLVVPSPPVLSVPLLSVPPEPVPMPSPGVPDPLAPPLPFMWPLSRVCVPGARWSFMSVAASTSGALAPRHSANNNDWGLMIIMV
ncbi:hypothetical protein ACIP1G_09895 [Pseudomonas sp. NPDC089392]|uniref:hypothetical protein n=1 Tax=Pseudomonas sp. NPDC089392 TaxID=3364459 RepID=UPI00380A9CE8